MSEQRSSKLYLVHCGYYDQAVNGGTFEAHANYFVVAYDFGEAREKAKALPAFKRLSMHVDGMQEVQAVHGHPIVVGEPDPLLGDETKILVYRKRGHDPKLAGE